MPDIKITDEMRGIIDQCRFEGNKVYLPNVQLDRKLYTQINAIFAELKGEWSRKEKAHVFPSDPREKLGILVAQEKLVDKQKFFQAYFTPPELAKRVVELAEIEPHHIILEPSCGEGALVDEIVKVKHAFIDVCEINNEFLNVLAAKNYPTIRDIYPQDFLDLEYCAPWDLKYDRVISNPPYNKNQWLTHSIWAYNFVKEGGRLVCILPNSIHSNKKFQDFVIDKRWEFQKVEAKTFEDTDIETNIVTILK